MKYIIMAGGTYKKFETPKQLLKVNNEVIIERTIRLLRENGIKDIAVSTNNPAFDYLDVEILHDKNNKFEYFGEKENKLSDYSWLRAYYPVNEPVCYLHGDVYFSDEAIKTIVETKVKDTMFFCVPDKQDVPNKDLRNNKGREPLAYKVENYKLFRDAVDDLLDMIDRGEFKEAKCCPIAWNVYRYLNNMDIGKNAQNYGDLNSIFKSNGDYIIINDYTTDVDDVKDIKKIECFIGGKNMIKVQVIEGFTLEKFNELKNIVRYNDTYNEKGRLYKGDIFECTKEMCDYLTGGNEKSAVVVKVIEVIPEIDPVADEIKIKKVETKPIEKKTRKKRISKK